MDEHDPVDEAESHFLEQDSDLVTISRKPSSTVTASTAAQPATGQDASQSAPSAVWFPLTLVIPLMAFAIVPSLLGRLVVIVLIVGAELKLIMSTPKLMSLLSTREWTAAASM